MEDKAVSRFATTFVTDTTNPPTPRPRWLRRGRFDLVEVADVIIALICFAATNSTLSNENAAHHGLHATGVLVLLAFVVSAPLVLRTRFPLSAWAVSAAAIIFSSLAIPPGSLGGPDVPVAAGGTARRGPRHRPHTRGAGRQWARPADAGYASASVAS